MIYKVKIAVNDLETETLQVNAESRDEAILSAIHTYNEYLDKGFINSYTIKGVN